MYDKIKGLGIDLCLNKGNALNAFIQYIEDPEYYYDSPSKRWEKCIAIKIFHLKDQNRDINLKHVFEMSCERVLSQLKYVHNARRKAFKLDILDAIMDITFEMKFNDNYYESSVIMI